MAILFVIENMTFGRLSVNNNPCFYKLTFEVERIIFITRSKFNIHHSNLIVSHRTQNISRDGRKTFIVLRMIINLSVNQNTNKNTNTCLVIYSYK
jgi:hypothetical protein